MRRDYIVLGAECAFIVVACSAAGVGQEHHIEWLESVGLVLVYVMFAILVVEFVLTGLAIRRFGRLLRSRLHPSPLSAISAPPEQGEAQ